MKRVRRLEIAAWAIAVLLWANLPYLAGYARSTPQGRFGGFFLYEQDGYSYLAKMRQGAQGAWTFHLPYTSEDEYQSGGAIYLFYLVLGKLDPNFIPLDVTYHAARLVGSVGLLWVLRRFIGRLVGDARRCAWAGWLVVFSGGWGLLISTFIDQRYVAYELIAPDAFVFSILYGPPHVIAGFSLLLLWIQYTLDTLKTDRTRLPKRLLVANGLGALTALAREAYAPAFALIFAAYLIALAVRRRALPGREAIRVALSGVAAGAYGLYLVMAFRTVPGLAAWAGQNPFTSPGVLDFVLGFAPLIGLALIGLRRASYLWASDEGVLVPAWLVAGPIMAYLPLEISRRLIAGWQIPLVILAVSALLPLFDRRRLPALALIVLTLPSTLLIILGGTSRVMSGQPPLYITADQQAALSWLGAHTTDRDVVLSDWRFGNLVPIYAAARVLVGHPIETIDFARKQQIAATFFTADGDDREAVIDEWAITWIVAEADRVLADQTPTAEFGAIRLYRAAP